MGPKKIIIKYVGAVGFGLLSLIALGTLFGLGINGIVVAQRLNLCERSNVTDECVLESTLNTNLSDAEPTSPVAPELSMELEWVYWLVGSTAAGVIWALLTSLALLFVVDILHDKQKKDLRKRPPDVSSQPRDIEMGEMGGRGAGRGAEGESGPEKKAVGEGGAGIEDAGIRQTQLSGVDEPDQTKRAAAAQDKEETKEKLIKHGIKKKDLPGVDESDHAELMIDYIGAYRVKEWHGKPLRHLGVGGFIMLFLSLVVLIMSLISLLWSVAIGYYHTNRVEKHITAFALVEFLAGFLLPLLLFISFVLLGVVVEHVTIGRVDARKRIKRFIPAVLFEEGSENDYWVIEERFYFKLDKRNEHFKHNIFYSCNKSLSTWLLTAILALALLLCLSYFVDITIVEEVTLSSCPDDAGEYDCFNRTSFEFVDCVDVDQRRQVELIHCFRFLRFAVDTNFITSFAQAFAFYLATLAIFGRAFAAVKTLLHLHRTRLWGWVFIVVGALAIIITIVFLGIEDRFQIQVSVLSVLQVIMACTFILLVGILVLKGDWYEKIFDHKKVTPLAQLLLHYDSISTHEVQSIEHSYAKQLKEKDPTTAHSV